MAVPELEDPHWSGLGLQAALGEILEIPRHGGHAQERAEEGKNQATWQQRTPGPVKANNWTGAWHHRSTTGEQSSATP
jgi:hypothetical protein